MATSDITPLAVTGQRLPERATGTDAPGAGGTVLGLVPALRAVARSLRSVALVEVRVSGTAVALPPEGVEALGAAACVAVEGAVRHGRASLVTVTVTYAPGRVDVVVRDDGAGPAARPDGLALRLPRRRLAELRGGLEVAEGRHAGAVVSAWLPTTPERNQRGSARCDRKERT